MKQTAVEWLVEELKSRSINLNKWNDDLVNQAKEMEKKEELKRQLFIGKVSEIIGFEKTLKLWQETLNEIR